MFQKDSTLKKNTFVFIGGFHLGLPLAFIHTKTSYGWSQIASELTSAFLKQSNIYELCNDEYELETKFPLGRPIILRHKKFLEFFNFQKYLNDKGIKLREGHSTFDNRIWILPTGIILVIGSVSIDSDKLITLNQFEDKIIEEHYPELAYLFVQVAQILFGIIQPEFINSIVTCKTDIQQCRSAITTLKDFESSEDFLLKHVKLDQYLSHNEEFATLLSSILVDVYYFHYRSSKEKEKLIRVGYVDSEIISSDPSYLLIISIAYSSFIGSLWIIKHLTEQARFLQNTLMGTKELPNKISRDLKLFRIFCLQFINESSPINVRLTGYYMIRLEECWREFRLIELSDQINNQLQTMEQMFDWIDEVRKEVRNYKIGFAAILLTMVSISAVTAQLISTIDFANTVDWLHRLLLIALGFLVGIISTLIIFFLPNRKKWYRFIKSRKYRI
jgi:hypothetical protein